MSMEDEARALANTHASRKSTALARYDEVASWFTALAREFAPTASRHRPAVAVNGINRPVWVVRIDPIERFYVAVYPDGSWSWLAISRPEDGPWTYSAVPPAEPRTILLGPRSTPTGYTNALGIANMIASNEVLTEHNIRASFVHMLAGMLRQV